MAGETPSVTVMTAAPSACPEIRHGGRVWVVGHPDQEAKARLERLAAKVALDEVRRLKGVLDPAAYQEAFKAASLNLKAYHTWREGWMAVVFDPDNEHLFLWSLLQERHPDVTEAEVRRLFAEVPEEVDAALAQVLPDFFETLLGAVAEMVDRRKGRMGPDQAALVAAEVAKARAAMAAGLGRLKPTPGTPSPG